jgi:hypothetical protein
MPTFQLPIALRIVGARSHECQAVLTNKLLDPPRRMAVN